MKRGDASLRFGKEVYKLCSFIIITRALSDFRYLARSLQLISPTPPRPRPRPRVIPTVYRRITVREVETKSPKGCSIVNPDCQSLSQLISAQRHAVYRGVGVVRHFALTCTLVAWRWCCVSPLDLRVEARNRQRVKREL